MQSKDQRIIRVSFAWLCWAMSQEVMPPHGITSLTSTQFEPDHFQHFREKYIFLHQANEPISWQYICETGIKLGTRADTVRHRGKEIAWNWQRVSANRNSARFLEIIQRQADDAGLNQHLSLKKTGKCLKTVKFGDYAMFYWHKIYQKIKKRYSKNKAIQRNKIWCFCYSKIFKYTGIFDILSGKIL